MHPIPVVSLAQPKHIRQLKFEYNLAACSSRRDFSADLRRRQKIWLHSAAAKGSRPWMLSYRFSVQVTIGNGASIAITKIGLLRRSTRLLSVHTDRRSDHCDFDLIASCFVI